MKITERGGEQNDGIHVTVKEKTGKQVVFSPI